MNRFRWLVAEWPISIPTLAGRIKAKSFKSGGSHGFVIDRTRDDYLEARYVERIDYTDTVVDPFGKEIQFDRVEFRQSIFSASNSFPGLELHNPPRSVQALLNRLSETVDFGVAFNQMSVDVLVWAQRFQDLMGSQFVVDSMQISKLQLEPGVHARALIKGEKDVRSACGLLTEGRPFLLEKIQLGLKGSYSGTIVLTSAGAATVSSEIYLSDILPALRNSLGMAVSDR